MNTNYSITLFATYYHRIERDLVSPLIILDHIACPTWADFELVLILLCIYPQYCSAQLLSAWWPIFHIP